jgi:hypothetical protein
MKNYPLIKPLSWPKRFEFFYTPKSVTWLNMIESVRSSDRILGIIPQNFLIKNRIILTLE